MKERQTWINMAFMEEEYLIDGVIYNIIEILNIHNIQNGKLSNMIYY